MTATLVPPALADDLIGEPANSTAPAAARPRSRRWPRHLLRLVVGFAAFLVLGP
jgi:hypothetical protein